MGPLCQARRAYDIVSSAFWKRPAWLFSALASVSNQSAISEKPSSRAVRAMPGYMSVYSCVSPAMAAFKFCCVLPIGETSANLKAAIAGETHEYTDMYPGMARAAREEGFSEIADWFETLAKAEKSHAGRFQKALDTMA